MRASAPSPSPLPVLALAFLAGCASVPRHQVPSSDELRRVEAVTVETVAAGTVVRYLPSRDPGAPGAEPRSLPRIELGPETQRAIADAVVDAGSRETPLRFLRAGEPGEGAPNAALEVRLLSVTLAAGAGGDPLTALWLRFQTRVALPDGSDGASAERSWLDPADGVAVDPRPRPLSEWLAGDGARVREAVAALSVELAPSLVADLRGGSAASCERGEGAGDPGEGDSQAGPRATSPSLPAARDGTLAPVEVEFLSPAPDASRGASALRALGGGVAGVFVGGFLGAGMCAKATDAGPGNSIGAALFGLCAIVAVPVGALVGSVQGVAKGAAWGARRAAALRAERERKAQALAGAAPPAIGAAMAGSDDARAGESGLADGGAAPVRPTRVRLLEEGSDPPVSALELEIAIGPETGERGAARRVCLRGPGPVPTELWLREDVGLLRASLEAQLARGVALARSGLEPQPGDGPCAPAAARRRESEADPEHATDAGLRGPEEEGSATASPAAAE